MQKELEIAGKKLRYSLKISTRAKHVRVSIYPGGECVVTVPAGFNESLIQTFLKAKHSWIFAKLQQQSRIPVSALPKRSKTDYQKYKAAAHELAIERLQYFNQRYNFIWNDIAIRNQKTRWGSCSKRGNLNFSYRICLLSQELCDYVIVHELCHLKEFNHSQRFWQLVSETIPNYKQLRKQLRYM